jgi:hypothetical protein
MKLIQYFFIVLGFTALYGCNSSKSKVTPEQLNTLTTLVQSKHYEITSDMAYPQVSSAMNSLQNSGLIAPGSNVNQINLIGNVNYLRVVGDSIYAKLPYFGERQMNAAYNGSDSSILIEGILQNYRLEKNSKDDSYSISFNAKAQTELLRFNLIVYPNLTTSMILNGPTRFPIRYTGTITDLKL